MSWVSTKKGFVSALSCRRTPRPKTCRDQDRGLMDSNPRFQAIAMQDLFYGQKQARKYDISPDLQPFPKRQI